MEKGKGNSVSKDSRSCNWHSGFSMIFAQIVLELWACHEWTLELPRLEHDYLLFRWASYRSRANTLFCFSILHRVRRTRSSCTDTTRRRTEGVYIYNDWCCSILWSFHVRSILRPWRCEDHDKGVPRGHQRILEGMYTFAIFQNT